MITPPFTVGRFDDLLISEPERCHAEALAEEAVRRTPTPADPAESSAMFPVVHVAADGEEDVEYLSFHEVMIRSMLATLHPDATPEERRAAEAIIREVPFPTQLQEPATPALELIQGGRVDGVDDGPDGPAA
jgi:hypothetical protein